MMGAAAVAKNEDGTYPANAVESNDWDMFVPVPIKLSGVSIEPQKLVPSAEFTNSVYSSIVHCGLGTSILFVSASSLFTKTPQGWINCGSAAWKP